MRFEVYEDKKGKWRFRLVAANNEIVAQSEGYETRWACADTIAVIQLEAEDAPVVYQEKAKA